MEEGSLYNQPVVLDNGSGYIKAGFAGEDKPLNVSPSLVGRPKYQKIMTASLSLELEELLLRYNDKEAYVGKVAQKHRGILRLCHPLQHGVVQDWDDMERLWHHTYSRDLKTPPEEHPLLITEAPLNPRTNRDTMCQVLFETLHVPAVYVLVQAVLSLYALGRTTGVVVDSGDGVTHVVPVYEGFLLPTSIKRMDVAGRDITEHLAYQIRAMLGVLLVLASELDLARDIKEKCCFVSPDPPSDEKLYAGMGFSHYINAGEPPSDHVLSYKLPDGHVLRLGAEQFRAPEILFNPQLVGSESPGVHELTALAIAKTDIDLRPILFQNIILSGGTTLVRKFGDRLVSELKKGQTSQRSIWAASRGHQRDTKMKIKIYAPPERAFSTWVGGLILASLLTFKKMWISAKEYSENPDLVHIKCM